MKSQYYIRRENEKRYLEFKEFLKEEGLNISEVMNSLLPSLTKHFKGTYNSKFRVFQLKTGLIQIE